MPKKNVLICFDAFGTLFAPKKPVHIQYGEVARKLGVVASDPEVKDSLKNAFKKESAQNPNYGKANGMNAEQWWSNIIRNTFTPFLSENQQLPKELVPRLLRRFWSNEGYVLMPGVRDILQRFKNHEITGSNDGLIAVGVVTNSDDRVPDILDSLGVKVSPLRYGSPATALRNEDFDIDFTVISYDVGHEKPNRRIFAAAEEMLQVAAHSAGRSTVQLNQEPWRKVYVGDEYSKDVVGALNAGWNAVLVGPQEEVRQYSDVKWLQDEHLGNLWEEFKESPAVGFSHLTQLGKWLTPD